MRTRPCAAILAACRFECVWFALLHIREPENSEPERRQCLTLEPVLYIRTLRTWFLAPRGVPHFFV